MKALPFILIFAAGIADYITTTKILEIEGVYEKNPYYIPFLMSVVFCLVSAVCIWLGKKSKTQNWAYVLVAFLVVFSWTGAINNIFVYWHATHA